MNNSILITNIPLQLNGTSVEVYKTNVQNTIQANKLIKVLSAHFPGCKINFDLEDVDKVLRIELTVKAPAELIKLIHTLGFNCEELVD